MDPDEDDFRALARSSPWRWRALEFRRHGEDPLHAWVRRPGELRVVDARGRVTVERESLSERAGVVFTATDGQDPTPARPPRVRRVWPHQVEPQRRVDGLVSVRPEDFAQDGDDIIVVEYGDPMHGNYQWVAMLDPVELSSGSTVDEVSAGTHRGRPVWQATMTAVDGYQPTCGCCPLLWSAISDAEECGPGFVPDRPYPESYRVALDVETGVVVRLRESGASADTIDLELVEVGAWT